MSGKLPITVSVRLSCDVDENGYRDKGHGSFYEMHALLVEQVLRWKTLSVQGVVEVPSEIRRWIPSELPNVLGLFLSISVLEGVSENDTSSREPFISAPRLTFCASDSPVSDSKYVI